MQNPLIIDLGTGFLKYGYPTQSKPQILPACLKAQNGRLGDQYLTMLDPTRVGKFYPLENGNLPECAILKPLILEIFNRLALGGYQRRSTEVQLLIFATVAQNHIYRVCDELREQLACQKLIAAYQQVLTLLLLGKHTGLVVDIGHSLSIITPIYQGFLLHDHVIDTATGGLYVTAALRQLFEKMDEAPSKKAVFAKIATDPKSIEYIKHNFCQVHPNPKDKTSLKEWRYRRKNIDVPLGSATWQAPEVLFDPSILGVNDVGLIEAIIESIEQTDITIRRELSNDIILTGGSSLIFGLRERVETELKRELPHLPINVYALQDALTFSWTGAASLVT